MTGRTMMATGLRRDMMPRQLFRIIYNAQTAPVHLSSSRNCTTKDGYKGKKYATKRNLSIHQSQINYTGI